MSKFSPTLYVVVPVYNEAGNIGQLLHSLETFAFDLKDGYHVQIVLVDDGSQDHTADLAQLLANSLDLVILRHERNQGPGRAFGTGFSYLATKFIEDDLVVTMEGDTTSRVEIIKQMLNRLEEGFDVILASPYLYGGGIANTSSYRIILSSLANLFVKELLGIHGILTVSSFFRLYRVPLLKRLQKCYGAEIIERNGFECMTELVMKMVYLQTKISEVAMVLDAAGRVGNSRMRIFRTIRGYFVLWVLQKKWRGMASNIPTN